MIQHKPKLYSAGAASMILVVPFVLDLEVNWLVGVNKSSQRSAVLVGTIRHKWAD